MESNAVLWLPCRLQVEDRMHTTKGAYGIGISSAFTLTLTLIAVTRSKGPMEPLCETVVSREGRATAILSLITDLLVCLAASFVVRAVKIFIVRRWCMRTTNDSCALQVMEGAHPTEKTDRRKASARVSPSPRRREGEHKIVISVAFPDVCCDLHVLKLAGKQHCIP